MLKEKLNKIFKVEGNSKKKIENLVFFLIILVVTVIVINTIWKDDKKENKSTNDISKKLASHQDTISPKEENLETKLENILTKMDGVGNVDVLITYYSTEEVVPIYNKKEKKSSTNETDSQGGTRAVEEIDTSQEVVYQNDEIVVQKTVSPKIEGAVITASGANNSNVKANIIQAVEAATRFTNT